MVEKRNKQVSDGKELQDNLQRFLNLLDSVNDTLPMTMLLLNPYTKKARKEFIGFLKTNVKDIEEVEGEKRIAVEADKTRLFDSLERDMTTSVLASAIIPESLFVSLISQYDAFINRLLRAIFELRPEILNNSERNITFSQLVEYDKIDDARQYIIEKEIDSVLRKSHSDQFLYLEKHLGKKLRKELPIWETFVEITERRNLFVHCDGVVSGQYIQNCKDLKSFDESCVVGDKLPVTHAYFIEAYECLFEISVKLSHTIWRILLPSNLEMADDNLNKIAYKLIDSESYKLADILLQFGCGQKKKFDKVTENIYIINYALSKYLRNMDEEAKKILDEEDWSASGDRFRLAYEIITKNYDKAYLLMKKIGKDGEVRRIDYSEWPLFLKIRETDEFKKTYREIFNEDYSVLERSPRMVIQLINKIMKEEKKRKIVKKKPAKKKKVPRKVKLSKKK